MSNGSRQLALRAAVTEPHARALEALDGDAPDVPIAVAWCSAHLVAADRMLYAAVQRRVPDGRRLVRGARQIDHTLQQAVCRLDRRLTGDQHLADVPVAVLVDQVRELLQAHADAEHQLVLVLEALLDRPEQQQLAASLSAATGDAPTRPHPHTRHTPASGLVARVDAAVDRARDAMDNRVVSVGRRQRATRPVGRWGSYLLGTPYPNDAGRQQRADAPR